MFESELTVYIYNYLIMAPHAGYRQSKLVT